MPRKTVDSAPLYAFDAQLRAAHGRLCGVDEAGRGPLCGPVCCAAVILNPEDPIPGVTDSKKLSAQRREALYQEIQKVYDAYFKPETPYPHSSFRYENAVQYGFTDFERREYQTTRTLTADEYAAYCGTHCDHLVIPEPFQSRFFDGLRQAVLDAGNRIGFLDTHVLYLARKPG